MWLPWVFIHVLIGWENSVGWLWFSSPFFHPCSFTLLVLCTCCLFLLMFSITCGCKTKLLMIFFKDVLYWIAHPFPSITDFVEGILLSSLCLVCISIYMCVLWGGCPGSIFVNTKLGKWMVMKEMPDIIWVVWHLLLFEHQACGAQVSTAEKLDNSSISVFVSTGKVPAKHVEYKC